MDYDVVKSLEKLCPNHKHPYDVCSKGGDWTIQCIAHEAIDEIVRLREENKDLRKKYGESQSALLDWRQS